MAINKVIYDGNTLIDLTEDTVDASTLLAGYTAHDRSGAEITGSFDSSIFVLKAGDTMTGALTLSGAPTSNLHAATKQYVDNNVGVVKQEERTSISSSYRVLLSYSANNTTETRSVYKSPRLTFSPGENAILTVSGLASSSSSIAYARLTLGNNTPAGTTGNSYSYIRMYGYGSYYCDIIAGDSSSGKISANRSLYLPNKSGTIAVTNDITTAIGALDGVISGTAGSGKTLIAFSQTDGIVSATFGDISITKSQITDFPILATVATSGEYSDLSGKPNLNNYISKSGGTITGGFLIITDTSLESGSASAYLTLGNNVDSTSPGSSFGMLHLYGTNIYKASIQTATLSEDRLLYLPNKSGTIAITDDLSGYLPLTGGTLTGALICPTFRYSIGNASTDIEYSQSLSYSDFRLTSKSESTSMYGSGYSELIAMPHTLIITNGDYTTEHPTTREVELSYTDGLVFTISGTEHTKINENTFKFNSVNMIKYIQGLTSNFATVTGENANLNTTTLSAVGRYACGSNATVQTQTNCPTQYAYTMWVENPTGSIIDLSGNWQSRNRYLTDITGATWVQNIQTNGSGVASWGVWKPYIVGYTAGNLQINTSGASFAEAYCKQYGKTVNVRAWITGLSTSTQTHTNVIYVQSVDMPTTPVRFVFTCWLGNGIAAYAGYGVMDTSGRITLVKAVANSDKASFEFTYNV